jgi:hypothetical protein
MEERMLEEDEKTSGSKERRQESRRSPCIESVGKVRSQGLSFLYTKKYRQVRPQDLDNGNVHEIRSTRSRGGVQKRDTGCGKHGRKQDPAPNPLTKSGRKTCPSLQRRNIDKSGHKTSEENKYKDSG